MQFVLDFQNICCGYSFELHRQVYAIQMGTHNICLYKEVDKKYIGYYLKTAKLLVWALIGVCAVIRSKTVFQREVKPVKKTYHTYPKYSKRYA